MKKLVVIIFSILIYFTFNSIPSKAITLKNIGDKLKKGVEDKIDVSTKSVELEEFFSNNKIILSFDGKKKEYRFKSKKYEVFEQGQITEKGSWKVSGLLKNSIRLKAENKKKSYYFKKIKDKPIIYSFDKHPDDQNAKKLLVKIEDSSKVTGLLSKTESTETITESTNEITESTNEIKDNDTKVSKKEKNKKKPSKSLLNIGEGLTKGISEVLGVKSTKSDTAAKKNNENKIEKHLLEKYRASSDVSYYFFEASINFLQSLELLYRAYDNNTEADKISSSIEYLKDSKSSESARLKSTRSIIGSSSMKIQTSIQDASYVLSEKGRSYYEQSLPFALGAAKSTISLYGSSTRTIQTISQSGGFSIDSLLYNANDFAAIITILPEIPDFSKNMIQTIKLIFSGAKEKKIRDEGKYSKALAELNLSDFGELKTVKATSEEPKKVVKKEEPKKVVKKKEPKKEEPKKVVKKEEPKKEEPKKVVKKKGKNNLKTKEDLENFLLQTIVKTSAVWDGKKYISDYQFKKNGKAIIVMDGQGIAMKWEAIDGNTIRMAQDNKDAFKLFGWSEMKINYDKLVIVNTQEKDPYNQGKVSEMKILSPKIFAKKEETKEKVVKKIEEGQIVNILSFNCTGVQKMKMIKAATGDVMDGTWKPAVYEEIDPSKAMVQVGSTIEIDFEGGFVYITTSESFNEKGNRKLKHKDKIISYDDEKLIALGSPYLDKDDIGEYKIEYTFFYNPKMGLPGDLVGVVNNKEYAIQYMCYKESYFANKQDESSIITYSDPLGIPKPYDLKLSDEAFAIKFAEDTAKTKAQTEAAVKSFEKQISEETKNVLKNVSLKTNKYGSTQLEQSQKITQAVKKEDFKKYNVDSLISYYFFESLTFYLSSLELLYKAYDKNTEAEKLKSQISYLKSSKASENERLKSTRKIIDDASKEIQADINNDGLILSGEAKEYYQKALPYAFDATDSGYKLFVVSKGLVTEVKGSTNLLGTLLKNANELKGALNVAPLVPEYVKNIGKTAKLIFTGAKTKKIKDDKNLGDALDELDLSA